MPKLSDTSATARLVGGEKFGFATGVATAEQIRRLPGSRLIDTATEVCAVGDSHTAGASAGSSYYDKLITRSMGRYRSRGNFAVGGKTQAQFLSDGQIASAIASGARYCLYQGGTNDFTAGSLTVDQAYAQFITNMTALRAGGVEPIVVGLFPKGSGTPGHHVQLALRQQLYCWRYNILYLSSFPLLSTVTGAYNATLYGDQIHLNSVGAGIVADAVDALIRTPRLAPILALSDTAADNFSFISNAMSFGGTSGSLGAAPSGWFFQGSGGTYSVVAPGAGEAGNWFRCAMTGGANVGIGPTAVNLATQGWAVGDKLLAAAMVRWVDTAQALAMTWQFSAPTLSSRLGGYVIFGDKGGATGEAGYYCNEPMNIDSGTVIGCQMRASGTGYFEINRPIVVNLTKLGVA